MIKIDNAPDPKKKAVEVKHILEKEKVDIYRFSENVLHELSDDNVPSTPNNYSIYFEKMLDGQPDEFRKEIGDMIVINSEISVPSGSNISIEKEIKQGFIQIKSMLQAVVLIYKNLGIMRGLVQKRMDALKNNTNILALQNVLSAFNHDLIKLNSLMDKHLDVIKVSYDEVAKVLKSIEEQSIYDTTYDVYNKKFLVATVQSEVEAVKRYGYNASFLLVRAKDRFTNRVNLNYRRGRFNSNFSLNYIYTNTPIFTRVTYQSGEKYFLFYPDNGVYNKQYGCEWKINYKNICDIFSIYTTAGWTRYESNIGNNPLHLNSFYWDASAQMSYKDFVLAMFFKKTGKSLYNETVIATGNNAGITLMWNKTNWTFYAQMMYVGLEDGDTYFTTNYSKVNPYKSVVKVPENGNMLTLGFVWNLDFGKRKNKINRRLNNYDNNESIVKVQE